MPHTPEPESRGQPGLDTPAELRALPSPAAEELNRLEQIIERGLETFLAVGEALLQIRDGELYRVSGYRSFSQYLAQRWHLTRQRAYQLMETARAVAAAPELSNSLTTPGVPQLSERLVLQLAAAPAPVRVEAVRLAIAGAPRRELHALVRHARAELALAAPTPAAQPARPPGLRLKRDDIQIEILDAARTTIADGAFDLMVSSPPYALDVAYADGGDVPDYPTYRHCMAEWAAELYRVSNADHGRVCLEVPVDRSKAGAYEPVYAHWLQALEGAGFGYRTTIFRRYHAGRGTARGSVDSPAGPHTFAPLLAIIVVYRGSWLRRSDQAHDLGHDDWLALAGPNGYWEDLPGEDDPAHPAPFHLEIPRRLLKLYSYRDDLVGDLFLGRGTTALACVELGRRFHGGDRSPTYVALAQERVALALEREPAA